VDDLSTKESRSLSYNITVYVISSKAVVQGLGTKMFTTLMEDFKPENITEIEFKKQSEIYLNEDGEKVFNLTIGWEPARDKTCEYEAIIHTDNRIIVKNVSLDSLYEFTFTNLQAKEQLNVGVRGINTHNPNIHSSEKWHIFQPEESRQKDMSIFPEIQHITGDFYKVSVSWDKPDEKPYGYQIQVKDEYAEINETFSVGVHQEKCSGVS